MVPRIRAKSVHEAAFPIQSAILSADWTGQLLDVGQNPRRKELLVKGHHFLASGTEKSSICVLISSI